MSRLPPMSKKRLKALGQRAEIRWAVIERDGGCLLTPWAPRNQEGRDWGPCFGGLTVHHLLKASQGGKYEMDNLVTLCVGHNDMVEDWPQAAHSIGLVRRSFEHE